MGLWASMAPQTRTVLIEHVIALFLVALVTTAGLFGWRYYDAMLLPHAKFVPTVTPTPFVDPILAKEQGRRQRLVADHNGAGHAFRAGGRTDLATKEYQAALAVDPDNFEARQGLREMGITPPPSVREQTPTPPAPTPRPTVTVRP